MKRNLIVLAVAVVAMFAFVGGAMAEEKTIVAGESVSCSGNLTVASKDDLHYANFSLTGNNITRNFQLNNGFRWPQTMWFTKEERAVAHGSAADTKVTNTSPDLTSKITVTCE